MSMRLPVRALWLGCLLLPACADQQESLILTHAPIWPDDGSCMIDPGTDTSLLRGTLDVEQGTPYLMPAVLLNNLAPQSASTTNSGTVTNEVQVTDADVVLESPQAPGLIDTLAAMDESLVDFNVVVASLSIPPSEARGFGVEVISRAASLAFRDTMRNEYPEGTAIIVVANVTFHGLRSGTKVGNIGVIDAREFSFPIQLCQGCLLDCSGCGTEPGECPTYTPGDFVGGVCGNAQDFFIAPPICDLPE
jgi:hypothetical protein